MINQFKQKMNTLLITSCISGLTICSMTVNAQENPPAQSPTSIEVKADTVLPSQTIINDEATLVGPVQITEKIYHKTIFSLLGKPKYPDEFDHLDYANPKAPKGGTIKLAELGTFDNFNRYASRGAPEKNSGSLYDTLFTNLADDITSFYPLIATSVTYSDNYRWAEVTINPNARFQDGKPITAHDVEFTFHKFMTEGVPQYRLYNQNITVKALDDYHVRIDLPESNREKLLSFVGNMPVIPQHFWQNHNFSEPITTPPVGSGPYFISDYKMGHYVVYQRNPNYWASNLPINKGMNNFDEKRIEYYMDSSISLEAFKAGEYDLRGEGQPKNWFTQYQGQYFDSNDIIKQEKPIQTAVDTKWLAFNLKKDLFNDVKVREAITLAFDFQWLNHAFYYDSYKRPYSFFENTIYAAIGTPSDQELKWLNQYKDIIPEQSFDDAFYISKSDGFGFNRDNLLKATDLLKQAGWIIKGGKLVNAKTNQPFEFELVTYLGDDVKYATPFQKNLARLGITMKIVSLDYAQFTRRLRERDYDMMPRNYGAKNYPSSDLMILWGSEYLNSSWNASGLHNQAIDGIIAEITRNLENESELIPLGRALDRILTHEYPMIPMWYNSNTYYAYWNKFGQPAVHPAYAIGIDSWWYDADKANSLTKNRKH
ncbi:ABC transporter substrate-binding protein [Gilliamella sp. B2840]|uniref:extracellular solute-binding protein n=1 Tax=Gilliamella sp. B2840 TaxID=2817975 RepID=UPI002269D4B0|nr:extracellular solute-binding protein [Gilliamella sp. B2840]MCX8699873.1 ABC transporter substrate-binding protein [Gilliamella sp. B2840]